MASGFRSYLDSPGSPVLVDMTSNISQMMGYVDTGAVDGYIDVAAPPGGAQFFYALAEIAPNLDAKGSKPGVSITNNGASYRIDWRYSFSSWLGVYPINCRIHYGYFV